MNFYHHWALAILLHHQSSNLIEKITILSILGLKANRKVINFDTWSESWAEYETFMVKSLGLEVPIWSTNAEENTNAEFVGAHCHSINAALLGHAEIKAKIPIDLAY